MHACPKCLGKAVLPKQIFPHVQSTLNLRRTAVTHPVCRGFFQNLGKFVDGSDPSLSDQVEEIGDGPTFARIDPDSQAGIGGSSDEVFGPLVKYLVTYSHAYLWNSVAGIAKIIVSNAPLTS